MTLEALLFRLLGYMLTERRRLGVARVADFVLRHEQGHRGHVTLGHGYVAHGARGLHCGMHGLARDLFRMARRAVGISGKTARVFDGESRYGTEDNEECDENCSEHLPFAAAFFCHRGFAILGSRFRGIISRNLLQGRRIGRQVLRTDSQVPRSNGLPTSW